MSEEADANVIAFPTEVDPDDGYAEIAKHMLSVPEPDPSPSIRILAKAVELVSGPRQQQHGDPLDCHTQISRLWTAYLGVQIRPSEVAMMLALLKIARTKTGKFNIDNFIDLSGYGAIAGELAERE